MLKEAFHATLTYKGKTYNLLPWLGVFMLGFFYLCRYIFAGVYETIASAF